MKIKLGTLKNLIREASRRRPTYGKSSGTVDVEVDLGDRFFKAKVDCSYLAGDSSVGVEDEHECILDDSSIVEVDVDGNETVFDPQSDPATYANIEAAAVELAKDKARDIEPVFDPDDFGYTDY
jgi:hypothetical protein